MSAIAARSAAASLPERIAQLPWPRLAGELDANGTAVLPGLLSADQCAALAASYARAALFRSRVVMAQHGFGRGEYQYFAYPLPELVAQLRSALYASLAPIANRWHEALQLATRFPAEHAAFLEHCHRAGQTRPTPLLLRYGAAITIACTRTCTATRYFRCSSRYCCPHRGRISAAVNSCSANSVRARSRASK
jgi:hypothetical protein